MKILFATPRCPYPPRDGGLKRVHGILRALSREHEVTLVTATSGEDLNGLRPLCQEIITIDNWRSRRRGSKFRDTLGSTKLGSILYSLSSPHPEDVRDFCSEPLVRVIQQLLPKRFDLFWIERYINAWFLRFLDPSRTIVDLDDLEHVKRRAYLSLLEFYPTKFLDYLEYYKLRWHEQFLSRRYYRVLVCSEEDRLYLGGANARVVPNGIDIPEEGSRAVVQDGDKLFFPGRMNYPPNIDAAQWFCQEIFPLIKARRPKAKFHIVGTNPTPEVLTLHDGEAVFVKGAVPDITPHFESSAIVVVPLRVGSGTRLKILDAFAHKRAVVSTTLGAHGLAVINERHLLLSDDSARFAEACLRLLENSVLRRKLEEEGLRLARDRYDWRAIEKSILDIAGGRDALTALDDDHRVLVKPRSRLLKNAWARSLLLRSGTRWRMTGRA